MQGNCSPIRSQSILINNSDSLKSNNVSPIPPFVSAYTCASAPNSAVCLHTRAQLLVDYINEQANVRSRVNDK